MDPQTKGTKVHVKLSVEDAQKLGIQITKPLDEEGIYEGPYTNGTKGHYVRVSSLGDSGRMLAIADKYNAVTSV